MLQKYALTIMVERRESLKLNLILIHTLKGWQQGS